MLSWTSSNEPSSSCHLPVDTCCSSFLASSVRHERGDAVGTESYSLEGALSPTRTYVGRALADEMAETESLAATGTHKNAARVRGSSVGHGQGGGGAVEATPGGRSSSHSSSMPAAKEAPRTDIAHSRGDSPCVLVEVWPAHPQTHPGSLTSALAKGHRRGSGSRDDGHDGAEVLQRQQLSTLPITDMQSSSDTMGAAGVPHYQHAHRTAALPSRSPPSAQLSPTCNSPPLVLTAATELQQQQQHVYQPVPPSALEVTLPRILALRTPSLQRVVKDQRLTSSSSTLCTPAVACPVSPSTSISQSAAQHTRSPSPSLRSPTPLDLTAPPKYRPACRSDTVEVVEEIGEVEDPEEDGDVERRGNGAAAPRKSSQSTRQRPRKLSFSGRPATVTETHFATASPTEAGALDKACVAPSSSTSSPAGLYSDANASGAPAKAQATLVAAGESKPARISAPEANHTLKLATGVAAQQQLPPLSPPRSLSHPLCPSSPSLMDLGCPARLPEQQRLSSHMPVDANGHAHSASVPLPDPPATSTKAAPRVGTATTAAPLSVRHREHSLQHLQPQPSSPLRRRLHSVDCCGGGSVDDAPPCVPQVIPTHDSVFFPMGTDVIAPVLLHYLSIAGWSTTAGGRDYFNHRRLRGGEVAGHTVRWLHTAKPRDRFVFLVTPVVNREEAVLESDTAAAAEQRRRRGPSSITGASPSVGGSEGGVATESTLDMPSSGGSRKERMASHGSTCTATTKISRWGWNKPTNLLQMLHARVFGEAPWFTYNTKSACAFSRITQVNVDDSLSVSDAATPSGDILSDLSKDDDDDDDDDDGIIEGNTSGSKFCSEGAFRRSPHIRGSTRCLRQSLQYARIATVGNGGLREGTPPHSMSPTLSARQLSQSPSATVMGTVSSFTSLSPQSVRIAFSSPGSEHATAQNALHPIASARNSSTFATPSTGLSLVLPLAFDTQRSPTPAELQRISSVSRADSGIYNSYVWSHSTGTASAASMMTSPVTPGQPLLSLIPAASAAPSSGAASTTPATVGVEVVVVAHADVTAMDYASRLTSHRLSIEAKAAHTYFFPLLSDALAYYQCEDAMELMEEQWATGVASQIPRPHPAAPCYQRQEQQWERRRHDSHQSATRGGSAGHCTSVHTVPFPSLGETLVHEDSDEPNLLSSTSRGSPLTRADSHVCRVDGCRGVQRPRRSSAAPDSTRDTLWGGKGSEVARDSTATGVGLSGPPLGLHRHHPWQPHSTPTLPYQAALPPPQSLSLSDALRNVKSMRSINDNDSSMPSTSTATSPTAAPKNFHCRPFQHPLPSDPCSPPENSFAEHMRSIAPQGHEERSISRSGARNSGQLSLSSNAARSPLFLPCSPAAARTTAVSASAAPRPGLNSQPQLCCRSPVRPRLTSSHGEVVVSVYTADPVFNTILRELLVPEPGTHPYTVSVAEQKRLLSMVEVGMPAWSIFYSSTGLPYRRLFRLLYSCFTNLWPLLSLAVGLYDLYKHLPQLKRFMEHTLDPITRWMEERFTIRISVLITYLISVLVTIFSSLSSFVSQFYLAQLFSLPVVQLLLALLKLPFVIAFDTLWTLATTVLSTVSFVLQVVRMVVMAPLVLVTNIASLREALGAAVPVAIEGTSMSVKWWRAWMEFWETVASPMKNAARAWWDSMMHVSTSAARRETSIRRWTSPKLEQLAMAVGEMQDCFAINAQLWWPYVVLPGIELKVVLSVALVYLYWLFLVISPELWDEVIYASGVRHHPSLRRGQSASPPSMIATTASAPSLAFPATPPADSHVDAQYKGGNIDVCDDGRGMSASTRSVSVKWSLYAFFHDLPQDAESYSSPSPSSASMQPPSTVSIAKSPSPAGAGSTPPPFAMHLKPQQTFSALVVELLLPNMVLELLHRARSALVLGWSGAAVVASRMAARHAKSSLSDAPLKRSNASAGINAYCQCSWVEALSAVCFGNHTAAEAATATNVSGHGGPMRRYVNPLVVDVRWDGDEPFASPEELLHVWQAAVTAKWGDAVGRETRRAAAAMVAPQDDATAAGNVHVEGMRL
ncbi:hypothetical protein LPMP_150520 [Leishmania panamensis]|uniref:Transmembrane protein n=1 Tax=Leishmania panamensis TaxID=5679 RepID=A0A088RNG9_LEIPA|nr:hypothetical protein LPMP_150520 [Leishmania panamensis]AIN96774.1 hypothetical protein LPMP_150520 [Leishmania panamensis]